MSMKIIYDNIDPFTAFTMTEWLAIRGKTIDDITEAVVLGKINRTDEDADAVFTADLNSGITKSGDQFIVSADATDFGAGKLVIGEIYHFIFGVKFLGDIKFKEITLDDDELEVKQDGIRG